MNTYASLFSPIQLRGLELKNRVFLPAMMTKMASPDDGLVTQRLIDYHVARAKGGCGLNITEVCAIDESTHGTGYLGIYKPEHEAGLKALVDAVHEAGGKICAQIWHGGQVALALLPKHVKPMLTDTMTQEDIDYIVDCYGKAVATAVRLGFDCVEFHAAHTYLPHTFLSAAFNQRTDEYNGSLENRARFSLEVIESMRKNMPEDMPLLMRVDAKDDFMPNGLTTEDVIEFIKMAEAKGVDMVDISRGNNKSAALMYEVPTIDTKQGYNIDEVEKIKKAVHIPVSIAGRVNDPEMADRFIAEGQTDMVAIGRAQITDPEFCNKAMAGKAEDIRRCIGCDLGCFDAIMDPKMLHIHCTRNPFVGKEGEVFKKAAQPKKVLIAGGGIGGVIAANVLKGQGHDPVIYEEKDQLGGQMILASKAPYKAEMLDAFQWEVDKAKSKGIAIHTGTPVTPELIREVMPDQVIIATGGEPLLFDIPGADLPNVHSYEEALLDGQKISGRVVILGGKMVGLEVAQHLTAQGAQCTLLEANEKIASDLGWVRAMNMFVAIPTMGAAAITKASPREITEAEVFYEQEGELKSLPCDHVVVAMGRKSRRSDDLRAACKALDIPFKAIGDAEQARFALSATMEAAEAALAI